MFSNKTPLQSSLHNGFSRVQKPFIVTVAAAAIAASASAPGGAQQRLAYENTPVRIQHVSAAHGYVSPAVTSFGGSWGIATSTDFNISFVNAGNVPATTIAFTVRNGNDTETIVDTGTFSPGTSITHDFEVGPAFGAASSVEVQSVFFADGTSWQRG
jgi:hypothetical protein